jgi:hypothetical protein
MRIFMSAESARHRADPCKIGLIKAARRITGIQQACRIGHQSLAHEPPAALLKGFWCAGPLAWIFVKPGHTVLPSSNNACRIGRQSFAHEPETGSAERIAMI